MRASDRLAAMKVKTCPLRLFVALRRLLGPRRSVDRRQRLEIFRDRRPVFRVQLRGVLDDPHHRAADGIAVRHLTSFEQIFDVLCAPLAKSLLRDIGYPTLAFRIWPAGEAVRGDDAAEKVTRAVALGAMAEAVDEVGTAVPLRRVRGIRHERLAIHEQPFPDSDIAPDIEWKRHVVIAHLAGHGGKRFQVSEEVADVLYFRMLVRRIGKGREVMKSGRRNPLGYRVDEFGLGPAPDAIDRIGRNVGRVEGAEWRRDGEPAAEPQTIGLAGQDMTGVTSSGV